MNSKKMAAVLAALVMVFAGTAIITMSSEDSTAAGETGRTFDDRVTLDANIVSGGSVNVSIRNNETAVSFITQSAIWYYSTAATAEADINNALDMTTHSASITGLNGIASATFSGSLGNYVLTLNGDNVTAATTGTIYLKLAITLQFQEGAATIMQYVMYQIDYTVSPAGSYTLTTDGPFTYAIGETKISATGAEGLTPTYTINGTAYTAPVATGFVFYASGLPTGLTMSSQGDIHGTVLSSAAVGTYTVAIYATDDSGNVYTGTMVINVTDPSSSETGLSVRVSNNGTVVSPNHYINGVPIYSIESTSAGDLTLAVYFDNAQLTTDTNLTVFAASTIINTASGSSTAESHVSSLTMNGGVYTLEKTAGSSGMYHVTVTYTNAASATGITTYTSEFYVYLYGAPDSVSAGIFVTASS